MHHSTFCLLEFIIPYLVVLDYLIIATSQFTFLEFYFSDILSILHCPCCDCSLLIGPHLQSIEMSFYVFLNGQNDLLRLSLVT